MSVESTERETSLTVVDGREALAYVLVLPNPDGSGVLVDAAANGLSQQQAAYVLRRVADGWDPQ